VEGLRSLELCVMGFPGQVREQAMLCRAFSSVAMIGQSEIQQNQIATVVFALGLSVMYLLL